jgi:hypothetical protein
MTDQPNQGDEPHPLDPEPAAPAPPATALAGTGRPDAADPNPATSGLAVGSRHYRDLTIARRLRTARARLGAAGRPATVPVATSTVATTALGGQDDRAGSQAGSTTAEGSAPRWALRDPRSAVPEVRVAVVLVGLLLAGVVAAALPEGAASTQAPLPGGSPFAPGIQVPATTTDDPATTPPGQGTGPVGGGELLRPPGSSGPYGDERGSDMPGRSPTSTIPLPSRPAPLPFPPPPSRTSPPTTIQQQATTTSAAPTTGPPEPTGTTNPDPAPTS